jgi:hypothetical protein
VPNRLLDVDPRPLDPSAVLDAELPPVVDLFALAAWRSPNRFCVPRIAPRLEVGVPGALEVAVWPVTAVLVLVVAEFWLVVLVEDDEADDGDARLPDELAVEVLVPAVPLEPEAPRLPRRRGAMSAANRSAVTTPLNRMVRWMSPVVMVAVRRVAVSGVAVPACLRAIQAAAAITIAMTTASHHPHRRGLRGAGRRSSGRTGGSAGEPVPGSVFETEALLI